LTLQESQVGFPIVKLPRKRTFNRGRWEVQRERARITTPVPSPVYREVPSVGQVISGLMRKLDSQVPGPLTLLSGEWEMLAGESVARHCRPGRLQKGRLTLFVQNAVWLNELARFGKARLLAAVQKRLGSDAVNDITFLIDPERKS
jgi:predicted nucleic acid-binding Zn ribbon protein